VELERIYEEAVCKSQNDVLVDIGFELFVDLALVHNPLDGLGPLCTFPYVLKRRSTAI